MPIALRITGICLVIEWFTFQTPGPIVVWYSDRHLINRPVSDHHLNIGNLNSEQLQERIVKVCYLDVGYLLFAESSFQTTIL